MISFTSAKSVVPNVGGTAPWGALTRSRGALKGQGGGRGALKGQGGRYIGIKILIKSKLEYVSLASWSLNVRFEFTM